jgi:hypothetical protein
MLKELASTGSTRLPTSGTIRPAKALRTPNVGGSVVETKVKPAADVGADREIVVPDLLFILDLRVVYLVRCRPICLPGRAHRSFVEMLF